MLSCTDTGDSTELPSCKLKDKDTFSTPAHWSTIELQDIIACTSPARHQALRKLLLANGAADAHAQKSSNNVADVLTYSCWLLKWRRSRLA